VHVVHEEIDLFQVLSRVDSLGQAAVLSGQRKIVHDFACLLEDHMHGIPEESWHDFEMECLSLVQRFKQPAWSSWQLSEHSSHPWQASSRYTHNNNT